MKTILFSLFFLGSISHADTYKPQVVSGQALPAAAPGSPAPATTPVELGGNGRPVQLLVVAKPTAASPDASPDAPVAGGSNPLAQMLQNFANGAGPTGNNWSSGIPNGSPGSSGAIRGKFDMVGTGQCGAGQDMWRAAGAVMSEGVIPEEQGYNIGAPNWPKLVGTAPNSLRCDFGPGKQSMCTSATAAAFCQHFADLGNSGKVNLTASNVAFINSAGVKAAINGNTFSMAYMLQQIGGTSLHGTGSNIRSVLAQAKTGDLLRLDRTSGTGHSTIFKEIKGDQFCYWTSNTGTNGAGVQCENISSLQQIVVSRFPSDLKTLPAKIDQAASTLGALNSTRANSMKASQLQFATSLECLGEPTQQRAAALATPPAVANR